MYHLKDFCGVCLSDKESLAVPQAAEDSYSELRRLFPEMGLDTQVRGWLCAQCRGSVAALCVFRERWLASQRLLCDYIAQYSPEPAPTAAVHITLADLRKDAEGDNIILEKGHFVDVWVEEPERKTTKLEPFEGNIKEEPKSDDENEDIEEFLHTNDMTNLIDLNDEKDLNIQNNIKIEIQEHNIEETDIDNSKIVKNEATFEEGLISEDLLELLESGSEENAYECNFCGESFNLEDILKDHLRKHTEKRPYHCSFCDSTFRVKKALDIHVRQHPQLMRHGERVVECNVCGKSFKDNQTCTNHMLSHTNVAYVCDYCNKKFSARLSLDRHLTSHTRRKQFICKVCKKSYVMKLHYDAHMRTHSGETSLVCTVCNESFKYLTSLRMHTRMHLL